MQNYPLFIAGEWIERSERCSVEVRNPATGVLLGHATRATQADLDAALESSLRGFRDWSSRTPLSRAAVIRKAADAMRHAVLAGRIGYEAGRMTRKRYATASSPLEGVIDGAGRG